MPELPDIVLYLERLEPRIVGQPLSRVRLLSPFFLRTLSPPRAARSPASPVPDCGAPVQRILYAENEADYCAVCQTGGKLLADRVLSQLLKSDWPKTLDELEERRAARDAQ